MKKREITEYVVTSFEPITLATNFQAIDQCVDEAIRWFDREGADLRYEMFTYGGQNVLTLPDRVDTVVEVWPDRVITEIFTAQTLLLGVTILDYDIQTLAMKMNHLADLRTFLASRMRWKWVRPYLHMAGFIESANNLVVEYLRHYDWQLADDDITGQPLDWILRYATALVKQREGRILRMGNIIQAPMDGSELMSEGKAEVDAIKDELRRTRAIIPVARSF